MGGQQKTEAHVLQVRRRLQHLCLRRIGHCPLCQSRISARTPPCGGSLI